MRPRFARFASLALVSVLMAGCQEDYQRSNSRHYVPLPPELLSLMAEKGMTKEDPVLIRSFKKEAEMEIWKKGRNGQYALLKTYPICRWSGQLGPKVREGDRQAPEGFYAISAQQMNPNSSFYLSFDTGYPNAYDRSLGRTGSYLMVHGTCSSSGCFAMTDKQIAEIYALVREAQSAGQRQVQMQSLPFKMTAENLAKYRYDSNMAFWKNLKEGSDNFEVTHEEPKVAVCGKRYVFNAAPKNPGARIDPYGACPELDVPADIKVAVAQKQQRDQEQVAELVAKGTPAVRTIYADGGQHPSFRGTALAYAGGSGSESALMTPGEPRKAFAMLGDVSRPEALESEPQAIAIGPDGKPLKREAPKAVAVAAAPAAEAVAKTEPATKAEATTTLARTVSTPQAPAEAQAFAPPANRSDQPFFRRMLGSIGLGSSNPEPAAAPSEGTPVTTPLPPGRPQASAPAPANDRTSSLLKNFVQTSRAALPSTLLGYSAQ